MARNARRTSEGNLLLEAVLTSREGDGESVQRDAQRLRLIRESCKEESLHLDVGFLAEIRRLRAAFEESQKNRRELKGLLEKLMNPPLHPAIFLGALELGAEPVALVSHGNARRVVILGAAVDPASLRVGDEVLLNNELNILVERTSCPALRCGQTALFDRKLDDGRVVLSWRDEEIVAAAAGKLIGTDLEKGDEVRWDENAWLALEKIDTGRGENLFLEETPKESFADIGGLEQQIEELKELFLLHTLHGEKVRRYGLRRKGAVLLEGPPGNGKTMMARALANWLASESASKRARFMNIKPGSLGSMWYSRAEKNIRDVFRLAREAGRAAPECPVVVFMDEIDSLGTIRGEFNGRVDDKVLNAFMVELDGLEARGNVVFIAATNRRDALDPALLREGRLGDATIVVPRPNRTAALGILRKYLRAELPYHAKNGDGARVREELIEAAVSRLYSPNGNSEIAELTFRDGKKRTVRLGELMTGASLARIANDALESACRRDVDGGDPGLQIDDLLAAIERQSIETGRLLTPRNCRHHLADVPQDVDVVRVDPIVRKSARVHSYLTEGSR